MHRWRQCLNRQMGSALDKAEAAEGPVAAQEVVVGPVLVLVLKPGGKRQLDEVLAAAEGAGLVATQVSFPETSPLCGSGVLTVGASATTLLRLAEEQGLEKRLLSAEASTSAMAEALASARACGIGLWRPLVRARMGLFLNDGGEASSLFSPAEVLLLLCNTLCASPSVCGLCSPVLAAQAAGELDAVLALPDHEDLEVLGKVWSPMAFWRPVPAAQIADYFGVGVAHYFLLMNSYAWWLTVPTCFGIVSFVWNELRGRTGGAAEGAFLGSLLSPAFTFGVIVWSTVCIINLRRVAAVSRHNLGQRTLDDIPRTFNSAWHHFKSRDMKTVELQTAGVQVQPLSLQRLLRYVLSVLVMLAVLSVSSAVVWMLLWVGDWVEARTSNAILQNSPVLLYLFVVGVLEHFYSRLAEILTRMEEHLSHERHVRSLTIKSALFQLINYQGWFLYLAFWRRDFDYLRSQLLLFFTLNQVRGNVLEIGLPWAQAAVKGRASEIALRRSPAPPILGSLALQKAIEHEYQRLPEEICDDYLEVAILFAAATWFAPVFPLGMLLAFLHAVMEVWGDSYKLCSVTRRTAHQGPNEAVLEAWLDVLVVISCLGIGISLALFRTAELGWDSFSLQMAEKVVLFFWLYLYLSIPDTPEPLARHLQQLERLLPLKDWLSTGAAAAEKKLA